MAYKSVTVTAESDLLTLLTQLNDNNIDNEALRNKMQDGFLAYKIWDDNQTSLTPSFVTTTTNRVLGPIPGASLDFAVEKSGFYRVVFSVPGAYSNSTPISGYYVGVGNNELQPDLSVSTSYYWAIILNPYNRYTTAGVYAPTFLQTDRWLEGGKTYSITGLIPHGEPGNEAISCICSQMTDIKRSAYIAVYFVGRGVE